jgi:hypothetical protein
MAALASQLDDLDVLGVLVVLAVAQGNVPARFLPVAGRAGDDANLAGQRVVHLVQPMSQSVNDTLYWPKASTMTFLAAPSVSARKTKSMPASSVHVVLVDPVVVRHDALRT